MYVPMTSSETSYIDWSKMPTTAIWMLVTFTLSLDLSPLVIYKGHLTSKFNFKMVPVLTSLLSFSYISYFTFPGLRCTLPDFPSVSSLACCHRTKDKNRYQTIRYSRLQNALLEHDKKNCSCKYHMAEMLAKCSHLLCM